MDMTGERYSTVWYKIKHDRFPKSSVATGRFTAWEESEILLYNNFQRFLDQRLKAGKKLVRWSVYRRWVNIFRKVYHE